MKASVARLAGRRTLQHYPDATARAGYLTLTVLVAITLAWEGGVAGGVAPQIIAEFGMSFGFYVGIAIVSIAVGGTGAVVAGRADRIGRTTVVTVGMFTSSLLVLVALPAAGDKWTYLALTTLTGVVDGAVGVAVLALVRDFSPQLRRGIAMGTWSLGPVLGALTVTELATHTLDAHPDWRFQFRVCGAVGLLVTLLAATWLRELAPELRNQVAVRGHDRRLIEFRAQRMRSLSGTSILRGRLIVASLGISVYLMFYYVLVGFFVVYLATTFGYSGSRANAVANWYWGVTAAAMVLGGLASDRLRVRKPFMAGGCLISATASALLALHSTDGATSYDTLVGIVVLAAIGNGLVFANWMAGYTETVEGINPGATAAAMALWSVVNKIVVTVVLAVFMFAVTAPSVLLDKGGRVDALAARYPAVVKALAAERPVPADTRMPAGDLVFLRANLGKVASASRHGPEQWRRWWWACVAGQLVFLPSILALRGRWRPRTAAADVRAHDAEVARELAVLEKGATGPRTPAER